RRSYVFSVSPSPSDVRLENHDPRTEVFQPVFVRRWFGRVASALLTDVSPGSVYAMPSCGS
ncbi:MAG: hypothetical protein V3U67_06845, partial [Gemmatimonadota bacterium]